MFKIEAKDFFPLKDDKDFKVVLKTPSFSEYNEALVASNQSAPIGGPDSQKLISTSKLAEKLFQSSILKVEGFMVLGKNCESGDDFYKHAPSDIAHAVLSEIMNMAVPKDDEIKN